MKTQLARTVFLLVIVISILIVIESYKHGLSTGIINVLTTIGLGIIILIPLSIWISNGEE